MNKFEHIVESEYVKNHSMSLIKKNQELMSSLNEEFDSEHEKDVFACQQLDGAIRNRHIYLAVQAYHNCLSRFLADNGISLPDLDTLVEKYHED